MARKKSNQLVCPYCGDDSYRSLIKGGLTRCCGGEVVRVGGQIWINKEDSPAWQLIQEFIHRKRERLPMYDIPAGSGSYKEAVACANLLMKRCYGDLDVALEVVRINFEEYQWRGLAGMWALVSNTFFPEVLAKAHKSRERQANARMVDELAHTTSTMQVAGSVSPW